MRFQAEEIEKAPDEEGSHSILSYKPLGWKERLQVSSLRAKRSVEFATGHCQLSSFIIVVAFALRGSPASYITLSPIHL